LVVGSCNGSRAAFPDNLLHITKRPLLTIQIHRDVERIRLRTVGHRAPALESGCARTLIDFDSELRDLAWQITDLSGLRIYLKDRLVTEIRCVDELAIRAIELPKDAELTHFEQRLSSTGIDENALEHFIHVLRLAGKKLVVPLHLSSVWIECESRVRVQRISIGAARCASPRLCLRSGPIHEIGLRIVAARNPCVAARAQCQREIAPCIATRFTGASD